MGQAQITEENEWDSNNGVECYDFYIYHYNLDDCGGRIRVVATLLFTVTDEGYNFKVHNDSLYDYQGGIGETQPSPTIPIAMIN